MTQDTETTTVTEYGIVWDYGTDGPGDVTWITADPDDTNHADIFKDAHLAPHATRVTRQVTYTEWVADDAGVSR